MHVKFLFTPSDFFFLFLFFSFLSFSLFNQRKLPSLVHRRPATVRRQDPVPEKAQPLVSTRLGAWPETISGEAIKSRRTHAQVTDFRIFWYHPTSFPGSGTRFETYSQRFTKTIPLLFANSAPLKSPSLFTL